MLGTLARAPGRAKQEVIARIPPLRSLSDRRHELRRREHQPLLASLGPAHESLVAAVERHGAAVSTVDALDLPGTEAMKIGAAQLAADLAADLEDRRHAEAHTLRSPREAVLGQSAVWRWGLSEPLLDLVEGYLGLPARYVGADVRCERATGVATGVRQWHRDIEDHRMLKILVWLNDVDADGGPFEYVDRSHAERLSTTLRYVSGFVSDEQMRALVPEAQWRQATGPTWTCVLADPRNLFHRAMPPTGRTRYSLTYSYTSRSPLRVLPSPSVAPRLRESARQDLTERQLLSLPPALLR